MTTSSAQAVSGNLKATKTNKIVYWIFTVLSSLGFLLSSFMYLSKNPELLNNFKLLGFPVYFVMLLGVAKLLGAIFLVIPKWPAVKEWAYAGLSFILIGAAYTHIATGTPFIAPLVFLAMLATSYWFNKKVNG